MGQRAGHVTNWGGGAFGFLRSLALLGPLTVPQIAQMRPTSRQRMQRLADELAADGMVTFTENPKHRRSKLVALTAKGEEFYTDLNEQLLRIASSLRVAPEESEIRRTADLVREVGEEVKTWLEKQS